MAEWRIGRGWTEAELRQRLAAAARLSRNFAESQDQLIPANGWRFHGSEAVVGREPAGVPLPDGVFARAWTLVATYAFSDPRIVTGHFDRAAPLEGRRMLLEIRVLGLHYLGPVVVGATRDETDALRSVRGFRYDTLERHFERGSEWFLLTKDHATGDITFRIRAEWQRGELPNFWSRIGFRLLAQRYQRAWHRLAHLRLRTLLGFREDLPPLPSGRRLVQDGRGSLSPPVQAVASGPAAAHGIDEQESPQSSRQAGR